MIWAQDLEGAIGKDGALPWHFSEDLKNFKRLTSGGTVVMGRKTWDSLPIKPLPQRRNIVISGAQREEVESYTSMESCVDAIRSDKDVSRIYIIGGMSAYRFFYKYADTLHITFISRVYPGADTFFPISLTQIESDFTLESSQDVSDQLRFTKWKRRH